MKLTQFSLSIGDIESRASVVLAQGNPLVMSGLRPVPPNLVYCGMMQCKPAKALPQDLQRFMDEATQGVLYVSFGSVLQGSQIPKDKKEALLRAFGKLKEKVLMKWESDHLEGKPDNMMVKSFLPQQVVSHLLFIINPWICIFRIFWATQTSRHLSLMLAISALRSPSAIKYLW
jgi:hypothetical protein